MRVASKYSRRDFAGSAAFGAVGARGFGFERTHSRHGFKQAFHVNVHAAVWPQQNAASVGQTQVGQLLGAQGFEPVWA